jgi:hypothetical protein
MMGREAKTRFYVRIDGVDRALFSVKSVAGRGLTITSRTPKFWENPDGTFTAFDHQHYSVHLSNGGVDTTITQKTQLQESAFHSIVTFVKDTQAYFLWPIFARRYPIFQGDNGLLVKNTF